MTTAAARQRQRLHRTRERAGLVVLRIAVEEIALTEKLVEAGFLDLADVEDRACVEAATERLLAVLCHM
jgi:hypothetical protein